MKYLTILILLFTSLCVAYETPPAIQLATQYNLKHDIKQYWISEKLDGVRGYWNGSELLTKNGNLLHTPKWFTANWPTYPIDGELWIGRHQFEQTISCVKQQKPNMCWKKIRFMIFDLPLSKAVFTQRIDEIKESVEKVNSPYFQAISQFKLSSVAQLNQKLKTIVKHKGEGLMLHYQDALYTVGRTNNIMKLKPYQDAEAVVLKHITGKGKYQGMLGAIQVKTYDGIVFKIGTGFSDKERKTPPPVGSTITFKYIGKTQKGVPKFASFLRIREQEQ
ncbi:DNA ligase [Colwellia sp. UCD-KL20]|uniref:DNA ligase n=1 Tax=Colwellia sp. UCD-KL20 TaxID=1917165 RepID=UPI000970C99C|nr:DNA ligase [Colwellia sp. UCD-KL20]